MNNTTKNNDSLHPLSPQAAFDLLQTEPQSALIDVRSSMEFLLVGHPANAVHIPWQDEPDWEVNSDFVAQVQELMSGTAGPNHDSDAAIILICRSGERTQDAGQALIEAGFRRVFHIGDGFEGPLDDQYHRSMLAGWRFVGLPWEQC